MQRISVLKAGSIHEHLQTCSDCRRGFADVCFELVLCGAPLERRELPVGARGRFTNKLPGAQRPGMQKKSLLPMDAPASAARKKANVRSKVETTVAAGGRKLAARIIGIF
jgi:hypothetical protein